MLADTPMRGAGLVENFLCLDDFVRRALQLSDFPAKKIYNRLWDLEMPPGGHLQNRKFAILAPKFYYCPCDVTLSDNLGSGIYYVFRLSPLSALPSE